MKRRALLAGTAGIAAVGVSGCLGVVGLDEHEASPAGVDPAVREETGYEQVDVEEIVVERSFEIAGITEEITVRNYLTEHEKGIDLGPIGTVQAGAFMVLTSPQISIAGRELNPIADMSSEELVGMIEADYDAISDVEHVSDEETTVLERETIESLFEGEASFNGATVDINVHITESVETTNDHLVTIGVYPKPVQRIEADNIDALQNGIVEEIERS
jgi:hypothetical protein